jgi:hypothetical protein
MKGNGSVNTSCETQKEEIYVILEVTQINYVISSETYHGGCGLDNSEVVVGRPSGTGGGVSLPQCLLLSCYKGLFACG